MKAKNPQDDEPSTILVVDDTLMNRDILNRILKRAGYQVYLAENGREGRQIAKQIHPDLILLDVQMPIESGWESILHLKSDRDTADIPVIFITALDDTKSRIQGLDSGAVDYIVKPFDIHETLARVRRHINQYRATLEARTQLERLEGLRAAQQRILLRPDALPEAKFAVVYEPLLEAGGDFYDVLSLGHQVHAYFLGDLAGHDLATSFMTSAIKALLRQNCCTDDHAKSMAAINQVLLSMLPADKFLTAVYLAVDRHSGTGQLVFMGHPPVLLLRPGQPPRCLEGSGDPLGAFPDVQFASLDFQLQPGDRLLLYSDGLLERNTSHISSDSAFSEWQNFLQNIATLPLAVLVEMAAQFSRSRWGQPDDDVVLLGVEF